VPAPSATFSGAVSAPVLQLPAIPAAAAYVAAASAGANGSTRPPGPAIAASGVPLAVGQGIPSAGADLSLQSLFARAARDAGAVEPVAAEIGARTKRGRDRDDALSLPVILAPLLSRWQAALESAVSANQPIDAGLTRDLVHMIRQVCYTAQHISVVAARDYMAGLVDRFAGAGSSLAAGIVLDPTILAAAQHSSRISLQSAQSWLSSAAASAARNVYHCEKHGPMSNHPSEKCWVLHPEQRMLSGKRSRKNNGNAKSSGSPDAPSV